MTWKNSGKIPKNRIFTLNSISKPFLGVTRCPLSMLTPYGTEKDSGGILGLIRVLGFILSLNIKPRSEDMAILARESLFWTISAWGTYRGGQKCQTCPQGSISISYLPRFSDMSTEWCINGQVRLSLLRAW